MYLSSSKISVTNRPVFRGYSLQDNGVITPDYFQEQQLRRSMSPPVLFNGEPATLHFWNYIKKTPVNVNASDLINHEGFIIRGSAIVVTGMERWHHMRALGTEEELRQKLEIVLQGLSDEIIFRPSGRWYTHQNIYVRNEHDAFYVRMAL